jgi:hypothetical protein
MKKLLVVFSLLLVAAFLLAQCKSSECTYKPKPATRPSTWIKH